MINRPVSCLLMAVFITQPFVVSANPFTTSGSSNSMATTPNTSSYQTNKRFAVNLGNTAQTNTFALANAGIGGNAGMVATPISCDLNSFAANFDANRTISNMGEDLKNFVKDSAQTYAVNKTLDAAAGAYAMAKCGGDQAFIMKEVQRRVQGEVMPKIKAQVDTDIAKVSATAATTPKMVYNGFTAVPDTAAMGANGAALGQARVIASSANSLLAAETARIKAEEDAKCEKAAKEQFNQYAINSMNILNGNFWNQVSLEAEQCALETSETNANPGKGFLNFLKKKPDRAYDLGIFTVKVGSGNNPALEVGDNSKMKDDVEKESAARTDRLVAAADDTAQGTLLNAAELKKWNDFKAEWDALIATGNPSEQSLRTVFDTYPVNGALSRNPAYADYWISKVYYGHMANVAEAQIDQIDAGNTAVAEAALTGQGMAQVQMLAEMREMRKQSLKQTRLLAEIISQRNDGGSSGGNGSGGGNGSDAATTGGVGDETLIRSRASIEKDSRKAMDDLINVTLQ